MNEVKGRGFILKIIRTQEADVIVKILLANGEKVSAYGRAALKSRKRFEGGLKPLTQVEFRAKRRENQELLILEDTKIIHEFESLPLSIEALIMASYFAELTESCAHEGLENDRLYNLLGSALRVLDKGRSPWTICPVFEVKLLSLMGWLPDFTELSEREIQVLRKALSQVVSDVDITLGEAQEVDPCLKALLRAHLGEGKIKSLDFFRGLRRFQELQMVAQPKNKSNEEQGSH